MSAHFARPRLGQLEDRTMPTNWTGLAGNGLWSDGRNWDAPNGQPPEAADGMFHLGLCQLPALGEVAEREQVLHGVSLALRSM